MTDEPRRPPSEIEQAFNMAESAGTRLRALDDGMPTTFTSYEAAFERMAGQGFPWSVDMKPWTRAAYDAWKKENGRRARPDPGADALERTLNRVRDIG